VANPSTRSRRAGSPGSRSLAAAARAAARRAERTGPDSGPDSGLDDMQVPALVGVGRVLHTEDPVEKPAGRRRGLITAVLAVLVVAGLVAVTVLGWKYGDARQTDRARAQALTTAQKAAPVILSYDYRHLDRDFDAARGHLTGSFRDEYRRTTTKVVAPTAMKYKGVVKATVVKPAGGGAPAASVVSASPDRAVVLLFVNQVTSSTQISGPRVDLNRVRMTLTLTSGGWKVSAVDAL
jgi:Mce-associated membrane protein